MGDALAARLQAFKRHGIHVLGSFIFGLPSDRAETFDATAALAEQAGVTFAQFVMLTPFPGTVDFLKWEKDMAGDRLRSTASPLTRYWLIPPGQRPKVYTPHPTLSADEIREAHAGRVGSFLQRAADLGRSRIVKSLLRAAARSSSSQSSIARCTPTPALRLTARERRDRRAGRVACPRRAPAVHRESHAPPPGASRARRRRSRPFPVPDITGQVIPRGLVYACTP